MPDVFLDGFFQFFFYFRLRLAEDVFDDGLASFRIVTDCVATLPAAILSLADVPLAVCSSFWHSIDLLCNGKPYRKQQRKATEKRNRYQKVIICTSAPRRLIFAYCGANLALPETFSLVTAVRFLNGQEALSIDYSGAKYV